MSYVTNSLATMSAITRANNAEMAAMRASQAQQDLALNSKNIEAAYRKETQLELDKIKAETEAKVARAEEKALKEAKSKKNKLDVTA